MPPPDISKIYVVRRVSESSQTGFVLLVGLPFEVLETLTSQTGT